MEKYTFTLRRTKYEAYEGNELVDERDSLIESTAKRIKELDAAIAKARDEAVKAVGAQYSVYTRPILDGHSDFVATEQRFEVCLQLTNYADFEQVRRKHGYIQYRHAQNVTVFRRGGLLCTAHCNIGVVNDKTPCSTGDWDRLSAGDVPKVFLQKVDGTIIVVPDPLRVPKDERYLNVYEKRVVAYYRDPKPVPILTKLDYRAILDKLPTSERDFVLSLMKESGVEL